MKNEDFPSDSALDAAYKIYYNEDEIDPDEQLYLITWSPDPEELPHADFITQHTFNVNLLADYLKSCSNGLFCVETTQLGNPHYHGWYQTSDDSKMEYQRIVLVKVLQRFGQLKITKCLGHYRINSYTKQANALYYYKADLFGQMEGVIYNPIDKDTHDNTDWNSYSLFFQSKKKGYKESIVDIENKISQRDFYKQFYNDSKY